MLTRTLSNHVELSSRCPGSITDLNSMGSSHVAVSRIMCLECLTGTNREAHQNLGVSIVAQIH